jgi:putative membrane protein (TIGR04086 family)
MTLLNRALPTMAGVLIDIGGTLVIVTAYLGVLFAYSMWLGPNSESPRAPNSLLYAMEVIGQIPTLAGGFVAGRVARSHRILYGASVGVFGAAVSAAFLFAVDETGRLESADSASISLAVVMGALGGYLATRFPRHTAG